MTALARRVALALLPLAFVAGRLSAQSGPVTLSVAGPAAQWRAGVRMDGVLRDRALREALESGLPLRFHFRVELWRKEGFDRQVGAQETSRAMLKAALNEGYTLEDGRTERRYATLAETEAALERAFQPPLHPTEPGRYYYLATLDVETLSLSDLEELRRWLRGEARPAVAGRKPVGRAVEKGLRRFVVRLLGLPTRRYEVRTRIFTAR